MAEQFFFDEGNVKVTNARFMVGDVTHQLSQLNQVTTYTIQAKKNGPVWMILIGVAAILIGLFMHAVGMVILFIAMGLLFIGGGILMLKFGYKDSYSVRFSTSSGQTNALTSLNKSYIDRIVKAINDAIASKV